MSKLNDKINFINRNIFGLRFEDQLLILKMYRDNTQGYRGLYTRFMSMYGDYINRLESILQFKEEYSKLNSVGRKFIRSNLVNRFSSNSYVNKAIEEKYGSLYPNYLEEYHFNERQEIDEETVSFYLLIFPMLPESKRANVVNRFLETSQFVSNFGLSEYNYPEVMKDDYNSEIEELLGKDYYEYIIMDPDKRMGFIYYLMNNQIPRALTYMSEEGMRRELRKHGRNREKMLVLSGKNY